MAATKISDFLGAGCCYYSCGTTGIYGEFLFGAISKRNNVRRRGVLTKDVLAGVPSLVHQGLNAEAIADRLGCAVGTLRVRCSQAQISLRVSKEKKVPLVPSSRPPKQKRSYSSSFSLPTTLRLSQVALSRLQRHAETIGVNEAELARDLLEAIALDDLYDAVLDREKASR